ncbi:D-glycero-beta-D-manno-heptose 1,7-bisphosphate 7-phosphatase [Marinimicrobium sp. ABcell2]|uniref:D-glycero-beta-D-manno-heptose 1,7-bisphosphate 7-phosphatase n=1 Tax=Marinimicrobium sp. ABcell2 TaxID=3069751 RepID=UPI0027B67449|nr:D-glycero-beta-D-manno-heptose 1,7-bisphosphate 7-phosphatase [Marinimicrobium sp. ABcell2]MDQ2076813.1 D-glycero-beta-D-manno-heptose 1,7-bisphosphate 7-phosphatase [Marinimicrobium sp. ABcell2]
MKLVILDRDGVINEDTASYIKSADECVPIESSLVAIAKLCDAGYTPVVATNQSGLGRGYFDLDDLEAIHAKLTQRVEEAGGFLGGIFYCPHHPDDGCKCRKPKAGILDAIEAEFNTSVEGAPFVGDHLRDIRAGLIKGCVPYLVRTGRGFEAEPEIRQGVAADGELPAVEPGQVDVFDDLAAVVNHLLNPKDSD